MLTLLGYSVHTFASGEEAIQYIQKNEAALLLLDMVMGPGINGRETYEEIIAIRPDLKTIIVSGFSESEDMKKMRQYGVDHIIKKPFRFEELAQAVRELRNGTFIQPQH